MIAPSITQLAEVISTSKKVTAMSRIAIIMIAFNSQQIANDQQKINLQLTHMADIMASHEIRITSLEKIIEEANAAALTATQPEKIHGKPVHKH